MNSPFSFVVADKEFYAPLETSADRGDPYRPGTVPEGWLETESGIWTMWYRPGQLRGVEQGWKVHVSARPGRRQHTLEAVADVCFEQGVAFKHLSCHLFYWWTHHKQAARPQSGKFIAAYPTSVGAARALMERLRDVLADEEGPYILTDRRFPGSRTVHYRYGAFTPHDRYNADGTRTPLVRDADNEFVEDRRGVSFQLPSGVTDPFRSARTVTATVRAAANAQKAAGTSAAITDAEPARTIAFHGFAFESALQFNNAGGAYIGREVATGRKVFIKEARAHAGVGEARTTAPDQLRAEWDTLRALRDSAPGLAPEPLAFFNQWEHTYLVTEFIEAKPLARWMALNQTMLGVDRQYEEYGDYYRRSEAILTRVEQALDRLHTQGYVFVDVSPGNVLVTDDEEIRLVDFESAHRPGSAPFTRMGTPGYTPPPELVGDDPLVFDDYGLSALALLLLGPFHHIVRRSPEALTHLHAELTERAPVPQALWQLATRFHPPAGPLNPDAAPLPSPDEVAADPLRHLSGLLERTGDGLLAMAEPGHAQRVFPTIAEAYGTNTLCLAYGTAGVVHALSRAGRPLPEGVLDRLHRDTFAACGQLAPGLYAGMAGIARVLADQGMLEEARDLLDRADRHPLTTEGVSATVFGGSAGLALAHLGMFGHTRDEHHIDRALALADTLPEGEDLIPLLGADDATGLMHGRTGVALLYQQLAAVTGATGLLARGTRLLHEELDRASEPGSAALAFPISAVDRRSLPYLYCGSAGTAHTVARYLPVVDDERLDEALPRLLKPMRTTYTAMPGLFQGLAGLGFGLADHAEVSGGRDGRRDAVRTACGLFKFAVPHPTGVRFLGDRSMRYSAELWSGSAGIMLFLTQLLNPRPDPLFTVDALATAAVHPGPSRSDHAGSGGGPNAPASPQAAASPPHAQDPAP